MALWTYIYILIKSETIKKEGVKDYYLSDIVENISKKKNNNTDTSKATLLKFQNFWRIMNFTSNKSYAY